jgi:hypothetical protein
VEAFGGLTLRGRALSAHAAAAVVQGNVKVVRGNPDVNIAAVQIAKFERGVIEPKFTHEQVVKLHRTSGASFTKVVAVIDEISGMTEDAEEEADPLKGTISEERFLHVLCRDLGWGSVDRMKRGLSNRELVRWRAFYSAESAERAKAAEKAGGDR